MNSSLRARAQLVATDVDVDRGGRRVLRNINLAIRPGTRLGVVGENGRGKSTLLKVLAGDLRPDAGRVHLAGSLGVAEQEIDLREHVTVGDLIEIELREVRTALRDLDLATSAVADGRADAAETYDRALTAVEAHGGWDADRRVDIALEALGAVVDRNRLLSTMSVGQRYRVRLACLLGARHDFLLLDEPTNHLDKHGLDFLSDALREHVGGIVLVSHDRVLLRAVATKILDLDPYLDDTARLYGDGFDGYVAGRRAEMERWQQQFDQHENERIELAADLVSAQNQLRSGWKPAKGTGKHSRATRAPSLVRSVNRRLADVEALAARQPPTPLRFTMPLLPGRDGRELVVAQSLTVAGRLDEQVDLCLTSGDRFVISGPNGAGKSTLLAVLAGRIQPTSGHVNVGDGVRVELLHQESTLTGSSTPADEYQRTARLHHADTGTASRVSLKSLGLLPSNVLHQPLEILSMGQRRRLDLALSLMREPHVLLLDEPTNHLSIDLVDELTQALASTPAAVVIATHDRQLLGDLKNWSQLRIGTNRNGSTR